LLQHYCLYHQAVDDAPAAQTKDGAALGAGGGGYAYAKLGDAAIAINTAEAALASA